MSSGGCRAPPRAKLPRWSAARNWLWHFRVGNREASRLRWVQPWARAGDASDFSAAYWEQNPDALLVLSPEGVVLNWNPAAEAIFGYAPAEAQGRRLIDLIVPENRAHEEDEIRA